MLRDVLHCLDLLSYSGASTKYLDCNTEFYRIEFDAEQRFLLGIFFETCPWEYQRGGDVGISDRQQKSHGG